MVVRFFGGYDFSTDDISRSPAAVGYAKGVPMGGDLPPAPEGGGDLRQPAHDARHHLGRAGVAHHPAGAQGDH
jgi:hypothetical protein